MKTGQSRFCAALLSSLVILLSNSWALPHLEGLQEAAKKDQSVECMGHEYNRRYNEVLRAFSQENKKLTKANRDYAHQEALKWVRDVWQYTDQSVVEKNIKSTGFRSQSAAFRKGQIQKYPRLEAVN
ncbi:MAG: hypothetical protein COV74_04365 [Candidatus Omnitrophica bacterium CG11_big_fil_rev_8_21_14_0_20_45_26]|uniref:SCP domain-containing protein n=1 Tax=Candidatus Abzuiibacterium crystallinum TaxID=1974748 RepID=A0A2H0LQ98_9BACT|nr:MAG: hypothetical protein COV74_04365 [Candidatus Omnitrophica bacterium CG11_big_fil_rev_8_21_14_0_20_45_26]PIW64263.1 MAG: hypothetical protein COW12_06885 [Candidatus Omnitrophica bacterium CG12_big_fil_rev_8_21_14_0_65_45_16]